MQQGIPPSSPTPNPSLIGMREGNSEIGSVTGSRPAFALFPRLHYSLDFWVPLSHSDEGGVRGGRRRRYNQGMEPAEPVRTELSPDERAQMEAWLAAHPYGDQDENGINLSLLRENLKLTPTQRLHRLQSAINTFWSIRHARD